MKSCFECVHYRSGKVCRCIHYDAPADVVITLLAGFCPFFIEVVV